MKKNIAILIDEEIEHPKDYRYHSLDELENLPDSQYENIYIGDLLDYIPPDQIQELLAKISKKLAKDGKLNIQGPDILQMCWYCSKFNLDISKFRYIIFQTGKKICYTLDEVVSMVSTTDLKIESASYINAYEYSIMVVQNEPN